MSIPTRNEEMCAGNPHKVDRFGIPMMASTGLDICCKQRSYRPFSTASRVPLDPGRLSKNVCTTPKTLNDSKNVCTTPKHICTLQVADFFLFKGGLASSGNYQYSGTAHLRKLVWTFMAINMHCRIAMHNTGRSARLRLLQGKLHDLLCVGHVLCVDGLPLINNGFMVVDWIAW